MQSRELDFFQAIIDSSGQGETPLKEVLQLMKKRKYGFPASIEYEYNTPEGSDVLTEIKKCVQFCKDALA